MYSLILSLSLPPPSLLPLTPPPPLSLTHSLLSSPLHLEVPPKLSPTVSNYAIIEGSSPHIKLTLNAAGSVTSFEWRRGGERIHDEERSLPVEEKTRNRKRAREGYRHLFSNSIKFGLISREDIGLYEVNATDDKGSGQAKIDIDVYCKCQSYCDIICYVDKIRKVCVC